MMINEEKFFMFKIIVTVMRELLKTDQRSIAAMRFVIEII